MGEGVAEIGKSAGLRRVSALDPLWKMECERLRSEGGNFCVADARTAEEIKFVATFATAHDLLVNCEKGLLVLTPSERAQVL